MNIVHRVLVSRALPAILVCAMAQALAADPEKTAAPDAAATATTSTATATPSAPASPAAATAAAPQVRTKMVLVDKTLTDAQVKQLLSQGYKPKPQGDQVLYCRREPQLGSRFETNVCRTAAQIAFEQSESKEMTERLQRTASNGGK